LAAVLFLSFGGCADRSRVVGDWRGERPVRIEPGQDPSVAGTLATIKLTIKPDGRFVLTEEGFDKSGPTLSKGQTWRLRIERILDRPVALLGPEATKMGGERTIEPMEDGTLRFHRTGYPDVKLTRRRD
jgi:hypothetical protein